MIQFFILFVLLFSVVPGLYSQIDDCPDLVFGQKPPGKSPEAFAPSIIHSENAIHGQIGFAPDGTEVYWVFYTADYAQNPPVIHFMRQVEGRWTEPGVLEFSREGVRSFCLSPDGRRMYFNSRRPWPDDMGEQPSGNVLEAYKIWFVERVGLGWGEPRLLDPRINRNLGGVSSTLTGTLYTHGIRRIRTQDGKYTDWEQLPHPLDVGRILGGEPHVSPDESYVLFNRKWPGKSGYAICISFRFDDRWTEPVNLLERIGAERGGSQPIVSPDGKYLFYYAQGRFYWMDVSDIQDLK